MILDTIISGLKAICAACGLIKARSDANNTPEMKANATAKVDAGTKAEVTKAVAEDDLDAMRKGAS